ncbi:hypothetical protein BDZ91DRAFT_745327 [Kalaharituber pfeilii]|nr:hypothetical protein BDZ91DRAFT_745327 [Kalaharituber pfeilii]
MDWVPYVLAICEEVLNEEQASEVEEVRYKVALELQRTRFKADSKQPWQIGFEDVLAIWVVIMALMLYLLL